MLVLSVVVSILISHVFVHAADSVSTNLDTYAAGDSQGTPYQTYLSNADVKPPQLQINTNSSGLAPGYVFVGVDGKPTSGQNFPVIYDMSEARMGTLVWTGNYSEPFDFKTQIYKGEPVLTFFSGELLNGYGHGSYYVLNQSYVEVAHFSAVEYEDLGDLHEFTITSNNTALVAIYVVSRADLTSFGGAADGYIFDSIFQEIDIESGDLVFQWNSTQHVAINETYNILGDAGTAQTPWDYFHINSVAKDADGNYLVSARVMDCIYKINGTTGDIIWRLQGKQSDFEVDPAANFAFQHDARWVNDEVQNRMTIFDNGPTATVGYSRGLLLDVDQTAKTVKLITEFKNTAETFAMYEGSLQAINASDPDTNYLLGFGSQPFFTELDKDGNVLLDVQFGKTNAVNCYRTYKLPWTGKPLTIPNINYDAGGKKAYLSWNGATEIETWAVYTADTTDGSWTSVVNATRTGFETEFDLADADLKAYVRGKAANAQGQTLGWTQAGNGTVFMDAPTPTVDPVDVTTGSSTASASASATSASAAQGSLENSSIFGLLVAIGGSLLFVV